MAQGEVAWQRGESPAATCAEASAGSERREQRAESRYNRYMRRENTYMGEERTAHYATGTDMFEIGGVVDTVEVERVVEENSEFMQDIFQNMDGHVDPMEYHAENHGSGA